MPNPRNAAERQRLWAVYAEAERLWDAVDMTPSLASLRGMASTLTSEGVEEATYHDEENAEGEGDSRRAGRWRGARGPAAGPGDLARRVARAPAALWSDSIRTLAFSRGAVRRGFSPQRVSSRGFEPRWPENLGRRQFAASRGAGRFRTWWW